MSSKVTKMESIIGHKIDYNVVLGASGTYLAKNDPSSVPPPPPPPGFESIPSNAPTLSTPCSALLNQSNLVPRAFPADPIQKGKALGTRLESEPSFRCAEPVPIMRCSFETNKFIILRFFAGGPWGGP